MLGPLEGSRVETSVAMSQAVPCIYCRYSIQLRQHGLALAKDAKAYCRGGQSLERAGNLRMDV